MMSKSTKTLMANIGGACLAALVGMWLMISGASGLQRTVNQDAFESCVVTPSEKQEKLAIYYGQSLKEFCKQRYLD